MPTTPKKPLRSAASSRPPSAHTPQGALRPGLAREPQRRLAPAERRAQIIDVAATMFGERPYAELSVREVAQAAGVTDNLVYHYFANKEALFSATFERRAAELLESCLPPDGLPLFEQFRHAIQGYLDFVETNATTYLNLFQGAREADAEVHNIAEQTRLRIAERYLEGLGIKDQPVPTTRLSLRGYIGFVEATVLQWLPERTVTRASVERLVFAAAANTLITALEMDGALPVGLSAAEFRRGFDRFFALV